MSEHSHHHAHGDGADGHCRHGCGCGGVHAAPLNTDALVSARCVRFSRGGRDLIDGVDLDVRPGEIVTLIGPNGAGKTTLVKLLLGLDVPDGGEIFRPASTRIGYVPQRFDVSTAMPMTVAGFLAMGQKATRSDVAATLAEVGATHVIDRQLAKLSGGETQRVLIARALLRRPNLLVLDEPARGIDLVGEAELYDLIGRLRDSRKLGVVLVSHDLHVVMAKSDRVVCVNGHICCSGKPETVSQHPEYARLFGTEAARSLGVYLHHHDHQHDLSGAAQPLEETGLRAEPGT